MVAKTASVDPGGNEIMSEGVHLDQGGQLGRIAEVVRKGSFGQRRACQGFHCLEPDLRTLDFVYGIRNSNPSKVAASTKTADHHIRVFTGHVHLLLGFYPNHCLVQDHVIEHTSQGIVGVGA